MKVGRHEWDDDIINDLFNDREKDMIMQIPLSTSADRDALIWSHDRSGMFSVKSCYRALQTDLSSASLDEFFLWEKIWSLKVPPKVQNLVWRICRGIIPTAEVLRKMQIDIQTSCCLCERESESILHIFIFCPFAVSC